MATLHKFTKRIAWTGRIWIAMLAAVIGFCTAAVFSAAGGSAREGVAKAETGTESAESDQISSFDQVANPRVIEQFFGLVETEAGGLWPEWLLEALSTGEWQTNPPPLAFHVPASQEENTGVLRLQVDRASAGEDLVLGLTYDDDQGKGSLFIGLSYWPEGATDDESAIFLADLFGNIMQGQGDPGYAGGYAEARTATAYFEIPIQSFSAPYLSVDIYRGKGEITVSGAVLYTKSEFYYWLEQALAQGMDGLEMEERATAREQGLADSPARSPGRSASAERGVSASKEPADLARGAGVTPEISEAGRPGLAPLPEQVLLAANYMIIRSVLDGGGTRQVSTNFILEDTVAQPSPIGFSTGSVVMLNAGYQQTEECILPKILNVGVIPDEFNHDLGEIATLSYVLNVDSPSVTIAVWKDPVTNTMISAQYQPAGLNSIVWLGTNEDGTLVTPGPWNFTITAACNGQTTSALAQVSVVKNIPVILAVHDEPDIFCPTQGVARIYYTTDEKNDQNLDVVRISLEDVEGNLVTDITYPNQPVGTYTQTWDGSDAPNFGTGGNNQPNGLYLYRINAARGGQQANEKTGVIVLTCGTVATNVDNLVELRYRPDSFTVEIIRPTGSQLTDANFALITADPSLFRQSPIYEIKATPETTFAPPALLTFKYSPAISGDIDKKLQIRRYDPVTDAWVVIPRQAVDFANNQVVAEITNLSFYALFSSEAGAPPIERRASVRLEPEALKVNPGILTAFVSLPEGYPESGIVAGACDGAAYESMMLNDDATEMVIKFRRQAIEEALAQQGKALDTHFIVKVTWQGDAGTFIFQGEDDITKIVN